MHDNRSKSKHRAALLLLLAMHVLLLASRVQAQSDPVIELLGQHAADPGSNADIWGYVDAQTGTEYTLVGFGYFSDPPHAGLYIFDVSDPAVPRQVAVSTEVPGFDVKVWKNFAYCVNGRSSGKGGRILDLSDVANPKVVGSFASAHNIFISDTGYLIRSAEGISVYDLNPDPTSPARVWSDSLNDGHDIAVIGDTLYDFHGRLGTFIYNFSDPAAPKLLGSISDPALDFHHSGWPTRDGRYLLICNELAGRTTPDITFWDISDLTQPRQVAEFTDPDAIVHNVQIIGDLAMISYYTAGFRVLDVSNPEKPVLLDTYDTSPVNEPGFDGAFGVYALGPSGNVFISDGQAGLFVFQVNALPTGVQAAAAAPQAFALRGNYPNPFNPRTRIVYSLPARAQVTLTVYNVLGVKLRALVQGTQAAGEHHVFWDGRNDAGQAMPSGVYIYTLEAEGFRATRRMLLVR